MLKNKSRAISDVGTVVTLSVRIVVIVLTIADAALDALINPGNFSRVAFLRYNNVEGIPKTNAIGCSIKYVD